MFITSPMYGFRWDLELVWNFWNFYFLFGKYRNIPYLDESISERTFLCVDNPYFNQRICPHRAYYVYTVRDANTAPTNTHAVVQH